MELRQINFRYKSLGIGTIKTKLLATNFMLADLSRVNGLIFIINEECMRLEV